MWELLKLIEYIINNIEDPNNQEFLCWLDELNKLSVRY